MSAGCELCGLPVGVRPFALAGFALFAGIATWFILDSNLLLIEP